MTVEARHVKNVRIRSGNAVDRRGFRHGTRMASALVMWCRRQDSNLRTVTDWDLIPAPLTKLGDSCVHSPVMPPVFNAATSARAHSDSGSQGGGL